LFHLARALLLRSEVTKQPEDVITATKFLFHLRDQPHEIPIIPRHQVTESLVETLTMQVELKAGNMMQNIREIAILSRELLIVEASDTDTTRLIDLIWEVVQFKIHLGVPDQPLDELIECLRAAMKHQPDMPQVPVAFAKCLVYRYYMTSVDDDYDEAMPILDKITTSGNSQDKTEALFQGIATRLAAFLAMMRSNADESPEYLEEAIYRARTCHSSPSYMELYSDLDTGLLEDTAEQRFRYFGSIEGIEEPSLEFGRDNDDQMDSLYLEILNDGDTTKMDEAIKKGRSIATSSPEAPILDTFCDILNEAFNRTKKIEYLNESISIQRQIFESPAIPPAERLITQLNLSLCHSLLKRSRFFPDYRTQDLDEGLELLSQNVNNTRVSLPNRLLDAHLWAYTARRNRHPTMSTAYETALSLMQDTLLFSPTLQLQHNTLATDNKTFGLPLDYASYRVEQNQLREAIEILERGRAILWSEMRRLRVSIDQHVEVDPDLGRQFVAVNRDLEELTKSITPSLKLSVDDAAADDPRAVDPFGRLLLKQRGLVKERAQLISQIRSLPGFDTFLASPSFDRLRTAASSGPVIIINYSMWRSDILILLHDTPPSLISTPDDFYKRAHALKAKLLESRHKYGLDSKDYDDTLTLVLAELYTLVGQPVIDRLHQLQVPEQSRIWWCPTSVFSSLPLHAMGPIPSDDGEPRYFLDLYICSYTPTLSALIQSRHRDTGSRSLNRPSILLVAQLNPSLPNVGGEIQVIQALDTEVSCLISEAATPATVIDRFHHHQFVHFACHGALEAGKPFEAGFELHGNARLTLLEIVRSNLPAAEFAFLSACHTAEMTEGSIMDEGLHLAAAVQYCGFRSVVGTMWAMADVDGRDLAKHFYKALFSGSSGMPYHERSAKALRFAVKKLRRKRGVTLERWVNFVHYGA
jgi:hypothetical protein